MQAKYVNPYTDFGFKKIFGDEASLKVYRDLKNSIDTAFSDGKIEGLIEGKQEGLIEGKREGLIEGKIEIAKQAKLMGLNIEDIIKLTALTKEDIDKI